MDIKFSKDATHKQFLDDGLDNYARPMNDHLLHDKNEQFGFYVWDGDKLLGGVCGKIDMGNWTFVDFLYLDPACRGRDLGTKLMAEVEKFARQNDCLGVHLYTWSFEAPEFYKKMGYSVFGELHDHPKGASRIFLKKQF